MRTCVYIDAFNLYFGALKNTPYRWLDLSKFCQRLLPKNEIHRIKYYTALVTARPNDTLQPVRQQFYLRALRTLPNVEIHLGHFLSHKVTMSNANPPPNFVQVIKTEEKGSDVNIAAHLLADGFTDQYDAAVVISNDSDLAEPVRIVSQQIKKTIGVINPQVKSHPSKELRRYANFFRQLRPSVLSTCQFPRDLADSTGPFYKPKTW
jgi:uncharacterized LabA/DUF88 family protein